MEGIRSRIKSLYQLPSGTEVFLCPSGSDAEYIPLLIAKTLNKGKKIVNIVTCDSEVGSGTLLAAGGRYFSNIVPVADAEDHSAPHPGDAIEGLADGVEAVAIPARTGGEIFDASRRVQEAVDRCAADGAVPIVHCVAGSKTGIHEPYPTARFGAMVAARDAFVVVDACQARFRTQWLHEALERGAMVLTTGSKFFRGPPFCGAVLVPGSVAERLARTAVEMPRGLRRFLTVPPSLPAWRAVLRREGNAGLALRWVAALVEMEPTLAVGDNARDAAARLWREHCLAEIGRHPMQLEALAGDDSATIISVRLRAPLGPGQPACFLGSDRCRRVFELMPLDLSARLGWGTARAACYIGQPVVIAEGEAVVRLALGSDSLRACLWDPARALTDDSALIRKLALLVDRLHDL